MGGRYDDTSIADFLEALAQAHRKELSRKQLLEEIHTQAHKHHLPAAERTYVAHLKARLERSDAVLIDARLYDTPVEDIQEAYREYCTQHGHAKRNQLLTGVKYLTRQDHATLGAIASLEPQELRKMRNLGATTLARFEEFLQETYGLTLGTPYEPAD